MSGDPKYKLLYLNVRSLGEAVRLVLHYKGIDFEDVRYDRQAFYQSQELKNLTPYAKVPVLHVEGQRPIAQSTTILRHLARKFGLNGRDEEETTKADEIVGFIYDCIAKLAPYSRLLVGFDSGDKEKCYNESYVPQVKWCLPIFERLVDDAKSGFLLASGLSYADFVLAEQIYTIEVTDPQLLNDHPKLLEFKERIYSLPGVKEYVQKRPKSLI